MKVMKFGGTSVKDADSIKRTVKIISKQDEKLFVVVSAFAGVTNSLLKIVELLQKKKFSEVYQESEILRFRHQTVADDLGVNSVTDDYFKWTFSHLKDIIGAIEILGEITPKSIDLILSKGEILSSKIISEFMVTERLNVCLIDSTEIIKTDSNFNEAEVDIATSESNINLIFRNLSKNFNCFICGGFIGSNSDGFTTTLGRGGSDYTAAIIASALNAEKLEIWTDVDGILTTDPRIESDAKLIRQVSYSEASELAYFGAKVLHPKTIFPAISKQIPVYVLNTFNPDCSGTLITDKTPFANLIKSIAFRRNITVINITSNRMLGAFGFLAKVFEIFKLNETSVDLVSTSEVSISLTIDNTKHLKNIIEDLSEFAKIDLINNQAIISAVGEGIRDTSGIAARFFGVLDGVNVNMITFGASEVNLSIIVNENDLETAVKLLHCEFFKNQTDNNIFLEIN
jgi:aspartate kinase